MCGGDGDGLPCRECECGCCKCAGSCMCAATCDEWCCGCGCACPPPIAIAAGEVPPPARISDRPEGQLAIFRCSNRLRGSTSEASGAAAVGERDAMEESIPPNSSS